MVALISFFVIVSLSLLITHIATVALIHTGMTPGFAAFQARSAFTGVGFTTDESEKIVNHPVRRRIVMLLMLLGSAGLVTAISSLMMAFVNAESSYRFGLHTLTLIAGVCIIWIIATRKWFSRLLLQLIHWGLRRWTALEVRDYVSLLHLSQDYGITELQVQDGDWLAHKCLGELKLREEGVIVLAVQRADGGYLGVPQKDSKILPGDNLVMYGHHDTLKDLDERKHAEGSAAHHQAIARHQEAVQEQSEQEETRT